MSRNKSRHVVDEVLERAKVIPLATAVAESDMSEDEVDRLFEAILTVHRYSQAVTEDGVVDPERLAMFQKIVEPLVEKIDAIGRMITLLSEVIVRQQELLDRLTNSLLDPADGSMAPIRTDTTRGPAAVLPILGTKRPDSA